MTTNSKPSMDDSFSVAEALGCASAWEPHIHAWAHLVPEAADTSTDTAGLLAGVPFAVKDVIDVAGMPTRFGSKVFEDAPACATDAIMVAALRAEGAVPLGKTRSTEFAFVDPTISRNPYNPQYSPGGSSSGSGAVVGAGIVPFALGTQTAGSLCRPAAYCGAFSYKPSLDRFPRTGMAPLSPSFDAIGVIARSLAWLQVTAEILGRSILGLDSQRTALNQQLNIGFVTVETQSPSLELQHRYGDLVTSLERNGHLVTPIPAPLDFAPIIEDHRTIMLFEAAQHLVPLVGASTELLQPKLGQALIEGRDVSLAAYNEARIRTNEVRAQFWRELSEFDFLLAYPTPGTAPKGLNTTGDQSYLTPWTALSGPLVSCPAGLAENGLPLGALFCGAPDQDNKLLSCVEMISGLLLPTPAPQLPPAPAAAAGR